MRDPNRIDDFCKELAALWHKYPDQRFGQFVSNILGEIYQSTKIDPFFIEDPDMLNKIKEIPWLKD